MTEQGADDLYEHRNDADEWDDQPVEIEVRPAGSEVVSFRLPSDELDRVMEAAEAAGESLSQFVRGALRVRLQPAGQALARTITSGPLARNVSAGPLVPGVHVHPGTVSAFVVHDNTGAGRTGLRAGSEYVPNPRVFMQLGTATTCEGVVVCQ